MKFPRTVKIFHGPIDAAPFAGVFLLFLLFVFLGTLVYTPGVTIQLPVAADLPGTDHRTVAVAVDARGQLFFDHQLTSESLLQSRLTAAVKDSSEPLTLLVQADQSVNYATLIRLSLIARAAGMKQALLATLPAPAQP
jgi:biopolymer transport protein ExbD